MRISDWSSDVCSSDLLSTPRWENLLMSWLTSPTTTSSRSDHPRRVPPPNRGSPVTCHRSRAGVANKPGDVGDRKYTCSRRSRTEEHTSELQSLMRISYAVFCLKKKRLQYNTNN